MLRALAEREDGRASLEGAACFSHRPARFAAAARGDAGLARRLGQATALGGHSGAVNALAWTEAGELLASGGEDCRLRLWRGAGGPPDLVHSLDTGHTAHVLGAAFLPGAPAGEQLLTCSADRQIRHLNVAKGAVRPYLVHAGPVRAVVPLDPHLFLSASEDGTVRECDVRQRPAAVHRDALAGDDSNVLVDQRAERVGRARVRVGILSLAVDPQRPWLMLTGGTDPLLRLYDRRMLPGALAGGGGEGGGGARGRAPQWVSCYAPQHLKAALWDSGRHPALAAPGAPPPPGHRVTSVAFARGGAELVGSYSGECIYSFDAAAHARDTEALLHIPESVLRAPARPRSHMGRRSAQAFYASSQERRVQPSPTPPAEAAAAAAAAEGGGGTAPAVEAPAARPAAQAGRLQQRQRAVAGRGIVVAPSVHQLAQQQRRQQSRIAAGGDGGEPPRAESSRPAHWQMRPTSSTLRSPQHQPRGNPHLQRLLQQAQQLEAAAAAGESWQHLPPVAEQAQQAAQHQAQAQQQQYEAGSGSEGPSDGVSPEGQQRQRQGVRRSRRIMRRRGDAADPSEDAEAEAAAGEQQQQQQQEQAHAEEQEVQQPTASGVAEAAPDAAPASSSDSEGPDLHSPATRRRVRRRTYAGSAADEAAAGAAAPAAAQQPKQAAGAAADGGFKVPPGRSPQQQRRQATAAGAAMQRLDSTLGLLHHHAPPLETSEVAAGGAHEAAQREATVSQRGPAAAAGRRRLPDRSPAGEVSSRPVLSASQVGLATQLGSQQAGHEASSLNSAEQPGNEHVGSVAQLARADAPSVGNAPVATTAAAPGAAAAAAAAAADQQRAAPQLRQQQGAAEGREASTGHWRPRTSVERVVPPPPQFGAAGAPVQAAQQQLAHAGARQRPQLQPTASTGTSRPPAAAPQQRYLPPAASGRQASRLRRHSALDALPPSDGMEAGATAVASQAPVGSGEAAPAPAGAPPSAAPEAGASQPPPPPQQQQQDPQQQHTQATMLSGRGPSVLGDFMPGAEQPADSEIAQRRAVGTGEQQAGAVQAQQAAQQRHDAQQPRRRQMDSRVGAIVRGDADGGGEEVSEPVMYRRCYAGHLNQGQPAGGGGGAPPLAPPLAFLGAHSELLVSPSDDGHLFLWHYASGRLAAVLPPAPASHAAEPTLSAADGVAEAAAAPPVGVACVAPHPLLPVLASGGADGVVRLWSPEAQEAASLQLAASAAQANLRRLADAGMVPASEGLGLLLGAAGEAAGGGGWGGDGVPHCNTM